MSIVVKFVVGAIVLIPVLYIGSCSVITHVRESGFSKVKNGDRESQVVAAMGQPTDREVAGTRRLPQYGAPECKAPCAERLWYPNKLSLVGEAWAVDLDRSGKVVDTAHIVSP